MKIVSCLVAALTRRLRKRLRALVDHGQHRRAVMKTALAAVLLLLLHSVERVPKSCSAGNRPTRKCAGRR